VDPALAERVRARLAEKGILGPQKVAAPAAQKPVPEPVPIPEPEPMEEQEPEPIQSQFDFQEEDDQSSDGMIVIEAGKVTIKKKKKIPIEVVSTA
jgi:hypothetical protein